MNNLLRKVRHKVTVTYRYLPDTKQDKEEILAFLNMSSINELCKLRGIKKACRK